MITLNNVCKVPLFSCGTFPQLSRPRHSVALVLATAEVFVQPIGDFRGNCYRQRRGITACKCTNTAVVSSSTVASVANANIRLIKVREKKI